MTAVHLKQTRVSNFITAALSETTRVMKSITAVLLEMTTTRALNSSFGSFDVTLRDDLLRGIACGIKCHRGECLPEQVGGRRYNVKLKTNFPCSITPVA